ncbi:UPF0481 protein [Camellia lanceoleosa]|uniref:UPF0481 protein n=1 Tax=Camellia lanceoleosa TaxID=1840588 RepID=A0ACC0FVE5_9ERIC|nr:UPF0481 protein [Camellia lanceoleosa]
MVIDDAEGPSKSKSESETINKVEELFTPRIPIVPPLMRNHENNKGMFDPKVVSIGPYHHGKEDLQLVENVKSMLATLFLQDGDKNMDEVYSMILENIDDYRSYYVKRSTDEYSREQFATMMLFDGCFILAIIEDFFLRAANEKSKYDDVKNHLGLLLWYSTHDDIFYLLENQLPFQVLELIMSLKFKEDEGMKSINAFLNSVISSDTRQIHNKDISETDKKSFHLLQLARTKYLNLNQSLHKYSKPKSDVMEYFLSFGSATELKAKGIHFRPNRSLSLEGIEFKSWGFFGRLELHPFLVDPPYKLFMSNMIAYEMVSCTRTEDLVITSYIHFMQLLIDNQDDVKELRSKHILFNALGSDQEVANVFKEFTIFGTNVMLYDDVKQRIQEAEAILEDINPTPVKVLGYGTRDVGKKTSDSIPLIFLITDRAVEDERHIRNAVKSHFANRRRSIYPRICTFGIGSYCNHYFLQMLAHVYADMGFMASKPDLYPNLIPDLSSGSPLIVSGRYNGNFPDSVKASGLLPDMSNFSVELEVQKSKGIPLDRVFARRQIDILTTHHACGLAIERRSCREATRFLFFEGVKLTDLQEWAGHNRFIRVIPSTPAVREAASVMSLGAAATEEDGELIAKLFEAIGKI